MTPYDEVLSAIRRAVPYTPDVIAQEWPDNTAKINGRFIAIVRAPNLDGRDQFGNEYEAYIRIPEPIVEAPDA
jgi:hypothetical protein